MVTVDYQKSKLRLTASGVITHKEETMMKKHTKTKGTKTKKSLTMSLREKCIALIAMTSLVFGFDGGMAPPTA